MDRLSIRLIFLTSVSSWIVFVYYLDLQNGIYLASILFSSTFLDKIDSLDLGVGPYSRKLLG